MANNYDNCAAQLFVHRFELLIDYFDYSFTTSICLSIT